MTKVWAIILAVLMGLVIICVLAFIVAFAMYVIERVFDELMKH